MKTIHDEVEFSGWSWSRENYDYLGSELRRLSLLLHRRALWLHQHWDQDPLQSYSGVVISDAKADWLLNGENRQAEDRFYQENDQVSGINRSLVEINEEIASRREVISNSGIVPHLDTLAHLFNLTPFERDLLLLCLAPELDPAFEHLYAYVQDDVNRRHVTSHLAVALFAGDGESLLEARRSLSPQAPLLRFRLIMLEPGLPGSTQSSRFLRLVDRVADFILGLNRLDECIADLLSPIRAVPLTYAQRCQVDRLEQWICSEMKKKELPSINLVGPGGAGKRAVAAELCSRLGFNLFILDPKRLPPSGPERQEIFRLLERDAILSSLALYLEADEGGFVDRETSTEELIERVGVFLIAGSRERLRSEREMITVEVSKPDAGERSDLWHQALASTEFSADGDVVLDRLVQQFNFGPRDTAQAVAAAKVKAGLRGSEELKEDDLWQACRERAGWQLNEMAQRIVPAAAWEDIVLPQDALRQLQEIAAQVENRTRVYEEWGFGRRLNRGRGISALFSGPSGTGKTMAAEVLANHLKLDLYRIDLAGVVSKYIGETEKNLRRIFDAAEQSGAILFFDEADALFGKRTEVKDSHDRYANIEVNYLLQRMEDYGGLAVLATNRKSALDQAFLRRLRFLVDLPFPDFESRRRIWQKAFPPQAALDGLDYDALSRMEISGGNIKNISLNAAFLGASEGGQIGMSHIMHAARREYAKIGKLTTEAELGKHRS
jgi:SpoVK/Ycf46/Vps4 family AAA+-type ATPase